MMYNTAIRPGSLQLHNADIHSGRSRLYTEVKFSLLHCPAHSKKKIRGGGGKEVMGPSLCFSG